MRRSVLALATVVALLIVGAPLRADDLVFTLFGAYLEALRAQSGIPGMSAAIVGDTDILWERAFGQQNIEHNVAMRSDTLFHVDGVTQVVTAATVLRCVEEGQISLDDRIGQYTPNSPDANATIRQVLTHTSGPADNLIFAYHPERLASLEDAIRACTNHSSRRTMETLLDTLAMNDSVPGADAIRLVPPADGIPSEDQVARYTAALPRLATPYSVDAKGRATPSVYTTTTFTPGGGLISTTRDFAKFDLALRQGILVHADTLAASWQPPIGRNGQRLPHGIGWFVQTYKNETVVWQFGEQDNASSSLIIKLPARGLTLILFANADGLVRPFSPATGDVTTSPYGRLFLGVFIR